MNFGDDPVRKLTKRRYSGDMKISKSAFVLNFHSHQKDTIQIFEPLFKTLLKCAVWRHLYLSKKRSELYCLQ